MGPVRTRKGDREAARILDEAIAVIARDGLDGATLGRIAERADTSKRMLTYYFGAREELLAEVVRQFGRTVADRVVAAVEALDAATDVVSMGIEVLWSMTTEWPELTRAYLALSANRAESQPVLDALDHVTETFLELFVGRAEAVVALGYSMLDEPEDYAAAMFAMLRGLLLMWTERGDGPELARARATYQSVATSRFIRLDDR